MDGRIDSQIIKATKLGTESIRQKSTREFSLRQAAGVPGGAEKPIL